MQINKQPESINIDDEVLIKRFKRGDSPAMEALIKRYQDRIFNVILKICANYDDAAELTQETFVKCIEKINTFKGKSAFYTWLFRIAVNLTINYCKRRVKLSIKSLDAPAGPEFDGARAQLKDFLSDQSQDDPAIIAQKKEIGEIITAAIARLDEDHRAVLVLRDIESMSYDEIAQALELELGTVKSRLSRARANLREVLKAELQ